MTAVGNLLTVRHAATMLGISTKRIYQLLESGRLESLRLGPRQTRVTRESLEKLIRDSLAAERDRLGLDYRP